MTPDISVITPHLNRHAALERLLRSLDAQDAGAAEFEIIVVDNGSDAPLPAAITAHPRVRAIHEPTPGPGPARNAGAAIARGAILAFIDCDCVADPGWIAAIARHFAQAGAAPVAGGDIGILLRGESPDAIEAYETVYGYRQRLYVTRHHYAATGNLAMRRAVFQAVGGFGGLHIAEDRDWGMRAHNQGYAHAYLSEMRVLTPARADFDELARAWTRHIGHDYAAIQTVRQRAAWVLRAIAVALSPLAELPRLLRSPKLHGPRQRLGAFGVLARIRLFRGMRMLAVAFGGDHRRMSESWRDG